MIKRHQHITTAGNNSSASLNKSDETAAAQNNPQSDELSENIKGPLPVAEEKHDICAAQLNGVQKINAALGYQQTQGNRYVQFNAKKGASPGLDRDKALKIRESLGKGQALPADVLSPMEDSLGHDLSGVRLHTDTESDTLVRQTGAAAFTTGNDIFFQRDTYDPANIEGRRLLGHELAHTVQQDRAVPGKGNIVPCTDRALEQEADTAALAALNGQAYDIKGTAQGQMQYGDGLLSRAYRTVAGWFGAEEEGGVEAEPGTAEYEDQVAEAMLTGVEEVLGGPLRDAAIEAVRDPEYARHLREARSSLSHIPFTVNWIKRAWDINERATDIMEVVDAFHSWGQVDAMEDPQGYAREAGRALSAIGRLGNDLTPEAMGGVRAYFRLLSGCGNFFTDILSTIEPGERYRRSGEYRGMSRSERSEVWTLQP